MHHHIKNIYIALLLVATCLTTNFLPKAVNAVIFEHPFGTMNMLVADDFFVLDQVFEGKQVSYQSQTHGSAELEWGYIKIQRDDIEDMIEQSSDYNQFYQTVRRKIIAEMIDQEFDKFNNNHMNPCYMKYNNLRHNHLKYYHRDANHHMNLLRNLRCRLWYYKNTWSNRQTW